MENMNKKIYQNFISEALNNGWELFTTEKQEYLLHKGDIADLMIEIYGENQVCLTFNTIAAYDDEWDCEEYFIDRLVDSFSWTNKKVLLNRANYNALCDDAEDAEDAFHQLVEIMYQSSNGYIVIGEIFYNRQNTNAKWLDVDHEEFAVVQCSNCGYRMLEEYKESNCPNCESTMEE